MTEILGYLASIGIGIILGLLGGGGSILSIPILVYLFHVDAVMASAYSLFVVGFTSLIGAIPKYRDHLVDIQTGVLFGIPSIAAIFITRKWIVPALPEIIFSTSVFTFSRRLFLLGLFASLMIMASLSMIRGRREKHTDDPGLRTPLLVVEGLLIGLLTGLVGAGGGFLIIPALVWLTKLPFKTAVGTSLFIIAINSLLGFLGDPTQLSHELASSDFNHVTGHVRDSAGAPPAKQDTGRQTTKSLRMVRAHHGHCNPIA